MNLKKSLNRSESYKDLSGKGGVEKNHWGFLLNGKQRKHQELQLVLKFSASHLGAASKCGSSPTA